jgi:hypothetical protein
LEIAVKSFARWNSKLQRQLKTEIPDLPEAFNAVLKAEVKTPPEAPVRPAAETAAPAEQDAAAPEAPEAEGNSDGAAKVEEAGAVAVPAKPAAPEELIIPRRASRLAKLAKSASEQPEDRFKAETRPRERERGNEEPREERSGGNREERQRDDKGRKPFDFRESLRGLEGYVAGLRSELEQTKTQLRRKEEDTRRGDRGARGPAEAKPAVDVEALLRHNAQLETTVEQLRQQLEDLASHHEAVAESRLLHTGEPLPEGSAEQLTSLLAIKLNESYSTYQAMRAEPLDRVFRLDYRDLLGSVFEVLIDEGVKLAVKP